MALLDIQAMDAARDDKCDGGGGGGGWRSAVAT